MGLGIGLLPIQRQVITQTNADLLSIWHLRTNFLQILIEEMQLKTLAILMRPQNVKW